MIELYPDDERVGYVLHPYSNHSFSYLLLSRLNYRKVHWARTKLQNKFIFMCPQSAWRLRQFVSSLQAPHGFEIGIIEGPEAIEVVRQIGRQCKTGVYYPLSKDEARRDVEIIESFLKCSH